MRDGLHPGTTDATGATDATDATGTRGTAALLWLLPAALVFQSLCGCGEDSALGRDLGSFVVKLTGDPQNKTGSPDSPLEFSTDKARYFFLDVEGRRNDLPEQRETEFHGWAQITVQPSGAVAWYDSSVPEDREEESGLPVKIRAGLPTHVLLAGKEVPLGSQGIQVGVLKASGAVRLVITDVGYVPAASVATARCNNSVDDDGDGYIDLAQDRGCYVGGDDSETAGTGATGASPPLYFKNPRIYHVQKPILGKTGGESPLKGMRATVDRGWLLVTRLGTNGMYVTDFEGVKWDKTAQKWTVKAEDISYDSVFIFNFSTPLNIQEGDCLIQLDGAVSEFFRYTELTFPTWKKADFAFFAAKARQAGLSDCPLSDQGSDAAAAKTCRQRVETLVNTPVDITTLMIQEGSSSVSIWDKDQTERYEAALVQLSGVKMFTEYKKCDINSDGTIDYSDQGEKDCANTCGSSTSCTVWESYNQYGQWTVTFADGQGVTREVAVVTAGSIQGFDPLKAATSSTTGKILAKVVGTLRELYFAKPPWILEPRRQADCSDCKN